MRLLMIYPNQAGKGHKPIGVSMISAVLKEAGHDMRLFDFTKYDLGSKTDARVREETLEFKEVVNKERDISRMKISFEETIDLLSKEIESYKPDFIGVSTLDDFYPLSVRVLREVKKRFKDIPTLVGGNHATVDAELTIKEDSIDMICIGEGEGAMVELANKMDSGSDLTKIKNIWVKKDGVIHRNEPRDLIQDLDSLPFPDWSIYDDIQFYKPFMGHMYRYGDFELSRGCPYRCFNCINAYCQELYKGKGKYHREKSIDRVIDEVSTLMKEYKIEFIKFWDETFLLMKMDRLKELSERYAKEVGVPFTIETTAQSVSLDRAKLLKKMGCASASIGMETGNEQLRRDVLNKPTRDEVYKRAFENLNKVGIRTVAFIMMGLPHQTMEDARLDVKKVKECGVDTPSIGYFYPYKGSKLREVCIKEGLISEEKLSELENISDTMPWMRAGTVLNLPGIDTEELDRIKRCFILYKELPDWMSPLVDMCGREGDSSKELTAVIRRIVYEKRFGSRLSENTLEQTSKEDS